MAPVSVSTPRRVTGVVKNKLAWLAPHHANSHRQDAQITNRKKGSPSVDAFIRKFRNPLTPAERGLRRSL